jgi:uncharacterized protein YjbI with pentapeptide repeats
MKNPTTRRRILPLVALAAALSAGSGMCATLTASSPSGDYSHLICPNLNIVAPGNYMQLAIFDFANLSGSVIVTGESSFVEASFVQANLSHAILSGGMSAYQLAVFVGANLTGATLSGGMSAYQLAVFDGANLTGATLSGGLSSFQTWSINRANFSGADLTGVPVDVLYSSFSNPDVDAFDQATPPLFDQFTRFPDGFDAGGAGWAIVPEPSSVTLSFLGLLAFPIRRRPRATGPTPMRF